MCMFVGFYLCREQAFDALFDGDEEEKSVATLLLDAIINVGLELTLWSAVTSSKVSWNLSRNGLICLAKSKVY